MNKSTDLLIGKFIKSWVGRHTTPTNARARLLWEAARKEPKKTTLFPQLPQPKFYHPPDIPSDEWSQSLFAWVIEHSFQAGLQARIV
jgi:hypothetical protein